MSTLVQDVLNIIFRHICNDFRRWASMNMMCRVERLGVYIRAKAGDMEDGVDMHGRR